MELANTEAVKAVDWKHLKAEAAALLRMALALLVITAGFCWDHRAEIRRFVISTLAFVAAGLWVSWDLLRRLVRLVVPQLAALAADAAARSRALSTDHRPLVVAVAPVVGSLWALIVATAAAGAATRRWWDSEITAAVVASTQSAAAPEGVAPAKRRGLGQLLRNGWWGPGGDLLLPSKA